MQALKAPTPGKITLSAFLILLGSFVKKTEPFKLVSFIASSNAFDAECKFPQS